MPRASTEQTFADYKINLTALQTVFPSTGTSPIAPTTTQRGCVLKGATIANIGAAPTQADFNGLLTALRTAGVIG